MVCNNLNECGGAYVTMEVKLTELNWLPSSSGKFYCDPFTVTGIKKILSVTFTDFGYLNANDNIAPLLTPNVGSALRFMSNVNTFNTGAFVKVIVHGTI